MPIPEGYAIDTNRTLPITLSSGRRINLRSSDISLNSKLSRERKEHLLQKYGFVIPDPQSVGEGFSTVTDGGISPVNIPIEQRQNYASTPFQKLSVGILKTGAAVEEGASRWIKQPLGALIKLGGAPEAGKAVQDFSLFSQAAKPFGQDISGQEFLGASTGSRIADVGLSAGGQIGGAIAVPFAAVGRGLGAAGKALPILSKVPAAARAVGKGAALFGTVTGLETLDPKQAAISAVLGGALPLPRVGAALLRKSKPVLQAAETNAARQATAKMIRELPAEAQKRFTLETVMRRVSPESRAILNRSGKTKQEAWAKFLESRGARATYAAGLFGLAMPDDIDTVDKWVNVGIPFVLELMSGKISSPLTQEVPASLMVELAKVRGKGEGFTKALASRQAEIERYKGMAEAVKLPGDVTGNESLLKILPYLAQNPQVSVAKFAEIFKISPTKRDAAIKALEDAGIVNVAEAGKKAKPGSRVITLKLTEEQFYRKMRGIERGMVAAKEHQAEAAQTQEPSSVERDTEILQKMFEGMPAKTQAQEAQRVATEAERAASEEAKFKSMFKSMFEGRPAAPQATAYVPKKGKKQAKATPSVEPTVPETPKKPAARPKTEPTARTATESPKTAKAPQKAKAAASEGTPAAKPDVKTQPKYGKGITLAEARRRLAASEKADSETKTVGDTKFRLRSKDAKDSRLMFQEEAQGHVNEIRKEFPADVKINVLVSSDGLPQTVKTMAGNDLYRVRGVVHNGEVYIVSSTHSTRADIAETFVHEVVGHLGIFKAMAKTGNLDQILDDIIRIRSNEVQKIRASQDLPNTKEGLRIAAQESLAQMAERGQSNNLVIRAYAKVREWLRKLGIVRRYSDWEIRDLVRKGFIEARKAEPFISPSTKPLFKKKENSIEISPEFQQMFDKGVTDTTGFKDPDQIAASSYRNLVGKARNLYSGSTAQKYVNLVTQPKKIMGKNEYGDELLTMARQLTADQIAEAGKGLAMIETMTRGIKLSHAQRVKIDDEFTTIYEKKGNDWSQDPNERKFAEMFRAVPDDKANTAMALHVEVFNPKTGEYHFFNKNEGFNYVPVTYHPQVYEALSSEKGPHFAYLTRPTSEGGLGIEKPNRGLSKNIVTSSMKTDAHLENARLRKIPEKVWLDENGYPVEEGHGKMYRNRIHKPFDMLLAYNNNTSKRLGVIKWFGQRALTAKEVEERKAAGKWHEPEIEKYFPGITKTKRGGQLDPVHTYGNLLSKTGADGKPLLDIAQKKAFESMWDVMNGRNRFGSEYLVPETLRAMEDFARAGQLSLATVSNITGVVPIAATLGMKNTLKNIYLLAERQARIALNIPVRGELEERLLSSRMRGTWSNEIYAFSPTTENLSGWSGRASKKILSSLGFNMINRKLNQLAALTAEDSILDALAAIRQPQNSLLTGMWGGGSVGARRMLRKTFRFTDKEIDAMAKDGMNEGQLARVQQEAAAITNQYREAETGMTQWPWLSNAVARRVLSYQSYARLMTNVLADATVELVRHGNARPMATLLFAGTTSGIAANMIKDFLLKKGKEDESFAQKAALGYINSAGAGLFGVVAQDYYWSKKTGRYSFFSVPQWEFYGRVSGELMDYVYDSTIGSAKNEKQKAHLTDVYIKIIKAVPVLRAIDAHMEGPAYQQWEKTQKRNG